MLTQMAGEPQQTEGVLKLHLFWLDPLRQGSPLRLRGFFAGLAQLKIGAVLAKQEVNLLACFGVLANGFRPLGLLAQNQFGLVGI